MDTNRWVQSSMVGSEEEGECEVSGGASILPFTDCPYGRGSSELEARKGGDSPAFGSKEGMAASCTWALSKDPLLQN